MKIIIIGSVAAGTSVAAKARRNNEDAEIIVYDQDKQISYSICGIPYYLGGEVDSLDRLTPRTPKWFKERYNVSIFTEHQVTSVDPDNKRISVTNLQTGEITIDVYDELVLATGARPVIPKNFKQSEKTQNVFSVRNITNASDIHRYILTNNPQNVTIVGAGFIGLEVAEQLVKKGLNVTVVQRGAHVMSQLDAEMAYRVKLELEKNKVQLQLNTSISELVIEGQKVVGLYTNQGVIIETDLVIITTGVAPNTKLVQSVPVVLGTSGAIKVDPFMQTSVPHIYAVGDVAESFSVLTGKAIYRPLGSTANKMGRIAGDVITGGHTKHRGILGTGILRVFGITVAFTGLTEKEAIAEGYELAVLYNIKPDHGDYLGGKEMTIKALADKKSGKILGAQIIGEQGVDKRIDVLATAISFGAVAEDLFHLDLAYAPPFSTTKDPIIYTGMALDNAVNQARELITPQELIKKQKDGEVFQIIDTRSKAQFDRSRVEGARHMPLKMLRNTLGNLDKEKVTIVYCNKGVTGNAAQNILLNNGFRTVYNLSGGNKNYQLTLEMMRSDSF